MKDFIITREQLASKIDNTILKPFVTPEEVRTFCLKSRPYPFASVCINPCFVKLCSETLAGSGVKTCTVIGFPLGANLPEVKAREAAIAVADGADELDMVLNIGRLKAGDYSYLEQEIVAVVKEGAGRIVKVIIETCYLTEAEKEAACKAILAGGAHFVKTSTGFGSAGATVEDIKLFKACIGGSLQIKASGGVRSLEAAKLFLQAGADRIGTSGGITIVEEI